MTRGATRHAQNPGDKEGIVGESERRWARRGLALAAAIGAATPLPAGPLGWSPLAGSTGLPPCPAGAPAGPSAAAPDLSVIWVDVLGSARGAFPVAAPEIGALLGRMGVQARVRLGDARSVSADAELTVVILPRRTPGARLDQTVMGATHRTPEGVRAIWVYASTVSATLGLDLARMDRWSPPSRREFGVALARVVVHELVHAVTPERPHSGEGLMAARMGRSLLLRADLAIDAGTAEAFRRALSGRARPEGAVANLPAPPAEGAEPAAPTFLR